MHRFSRSPRDDRGVVALEIALVLPVILFLLVASVSIAGLLQTKSRVVGAARDGARKLALQAGVASPTADPNTTDGITVVLEGAACPALTNTAYQSATPPQVNAKASITYTIEIPFFGTWGDRTVTEIATMPCG